MKENATNKRTVWIARWQFVFDHNPVAIYAIGCTSHFYDVVCRREYSSQASEVLLAKRRLYASLLRGVGYQDVIGKMIATAFCCPPIALERWQRIVGSPPEPLMYTVIVF